MKWSWKFAFDFGWYKGEEFSLIDVKICEKSEGFFTILYIKIFKFVIAAYLSKE
jgi:hypothetical protein